MNRAHTLAFGLAAAIALSPTAARAQYAGPENTPEACHDGVDNDGDGYADCYDPKCRYLPFCQAPPPVPPPIAAPPPGYYAPPPPGYGQPPPGYVYAPPPPLYVQPQVVARPVGTGVGEIIAGSILFPVGLILLGTSDILWTDACGYGRDCFFGAYAGEAAGAVVMDIIGAGATVVGAIMIPVGIVKAARYSRWKRTQPVGLLDRLEPTVTTGKNGGSIGVKLTF